MAVVLFGRSQVTVPLTTRKIEAGIYDDENMEVKSGLTSDSQVIVSWSNELVDQGEVLLAQDTDGAQTDGNNETAAETTEAGDKE